MQATDQQIHAVTSHPSMVTTYCTKTLPLRLVVHSFGSVWVIKISPSLDTYLPMTTEDETESKNNLFTYSNFSLIFASINFRDFRH